MKEPVRFRCGCTVSRSSLGKKQVFSIFLCARHMKDPQLARSMRYATSRIYGLQRKEKSK